MSKSSAAASAQRVGLPATVQTPHRFEPGGLTGKSVCGYRCWKSSRSFRARIWNGIARTTSRIHSGAHDRTPRRSTVTPGRRSCRSSSCSRRAGESTRSPECRRLRRGRRRPGPMRRLRRLMRDRSVSPRCLFSRSRRVACPVRRLGAPGHRGVVPQHRLFALASRDDVPEHRAVAPGLWLNVPGEVRRDPGAMPFRAGTLGRSPGAIAQVPGRLPRCPGVNKQSPHALGPRSRGNEAAHRGSGPAHGEIAATHRCSAVEARGDVKNAWDDAAKSRSDEPLSRGVVTFFRERD